MLTSHELLAMHKELARDIKDYQRQLADEVLQELRCARCRPAPVPVPTDSELSRALLVTPTPALAPAPQETPKPTPAPTPTDSELCRALQLLTSDVKSTIANQQVLQQPDCFLKQSTPGTPSKDSAETLDRARRTSLTHLHTYGSRHEVIVRAVQDKNPWFAREIPNNFASRLALAPPFQALCLLVILLNMILISFDTDARMSALLSNGSKDVSLVYSWLHALIDGIFLIELTIRIYGLRWFFFGRHGWEWNIADAFFIVAPCLANLLHLVWSHLPIRPEGILHIVSILRTMDVMRIFRSIRLLKLLRELGLFRVLRQILVQVMGSLYHLFWSSVLLMLITHAFSIFLLQGIIVHFRDKTFEGVNIKDHLEEYYDGTGTTMWSLFSSLTGGRSWIDLIEPLQNLPMFYWLAVASFVWFVMTVVLNLIICSFLEAIQGPQGIDATIDMQHQRDEEFVTHTRNLFFRFERKHKSRGGVLPWDFVLNEMCSCNDVQAYLASLEIDCSGGVFDMLFGRADPEQITAEEFSVALLRLKGYATKSDVFFVGKLIEDIHMRLEQP